MVAVIGKGNVLQSTDEIGIVRGTDEGYATIASLMAVIQPLLPADIYMVSGAVDGDDIDITMSDGTVVTIPGAAADVRITGFAVNGTNLEIVENDGSTWTIPVSAIGSLLTIVSGDVGNAITVGTDGGAFIDAAAINALVVDLFGPSADAANILTAGSDGLSMLTAAAINAVIIDQFGPSVDAGNLLTAGSDGLAMLATLISGDAGNALTVGSDGLVYLTGNLPSSDTASAGVEKIGNDYQLDIDSLTISAITADDTIAFDDTADGVDKRVTLDAATAAALTNAGGTGGSASAAALADLLCPRKYKGFATDDFGGVDPAAVSAAPGSALQDTLYGFFFYQYWDVTTGKMMLWDKDANTFVENPCCTEELNIIFDDLQAATGAKMESILEGTSATACTFTGLTCDGNPITAAMITITGSDAALFQIDPATLDLSLNFSPDFETPVDANTDNVYEAIVTVNDGTCTEDVAVAITVTDVLETIVLTDGNLNDDMEAVSIPEDTTATGFNMAGTACDMVTPLTAAMMSLSGPDAALFQLTAALDVEFIAAPDFEIPTDANTDNVYEVTVNINDGTCTKDVALTVTITDVPTMIVFDDPTNGAAYNAGTKADNMDEGNTATGCLFTGLACDEVTPLVAANLTLSGPDAALFQIDPATLELQFVTAPAFATPTDANADNVYEVTVTADDGTGACPAAPVDVQITIDENACLDNQAAADGGLQLQYLWNVPGAIAGQLSVAGMNAQYGTSSAFNFQANHYAVTSLGMDELAAGTLPDGTPTYNTTLTANADTIDTGIVSDFAVPNNYLGLGNGTEGFLFSGKFVAPCSLTGAQDIYFRFSTAADNIQENKLWLWQGTGPAAVTTATVSHYMRRGSTAQGGAAITQDPPAIVTAGPGDTIGLVFLAFDAWASIDGNIEVSFDNGSSWAPLVTAADLTDVGFVVDSCQ